MFPRWSMGTIKGRATPPGLSGSSKLGCALLFPLQIDDGIIRMIAYTKGSLLSLHAPCGPCPARIFNVIPCHSEIARQLCDQLFPHLIVDRSHVPAWERSPGRSGVHHCPAPWAIFDAFPVVGAAAARSTRRLVTLERHNDVPTLERGNDQLCMGNNEGLAPWSVP